MRKNPLRYTVETARVEPRRQSDFVDFSVPSETFFVRKKLEIFEQQFEITLVIDDTK